jgi:hypothetical protein
MNRLFVLPKANRDTRWDKSGWHQPCFFIGSKEVSETEYRIHLHKEGRSEKEIELFFKMVREMRFED